MPDIRISDVYPAVQVLERGEVEMEDLKAVLIDKVQGIGGRFSDLIKFLRTIGLVGESNGKVKLIESTLGQSIPDLITRKIFDCREFAQEFAKHCTLVEILQLDRKYIRVSAYHTSFEFIWFLLLLEQLEVLQREHNSILVVSESQTEAFFSFLSGSLNAIDSSHVVSPEQLQAQQSANAAHGLAAELFVMEFERRRLSDHVLLDSIRHVALTDVTAGFDILSFEGENELMPRRMIEVKSWSNTKRFFISANEVNVAREAGDNYHIYLVDRSRMNDKEYSPEIFTNPGDTFFGELKRDGWEVVCDGWVLTSIAQDES